MSIYSDPLFLAMAGASGKETAIKAFPTATIENTSVASFQDGASGIPVEALTLNITRSQAEGTPSPENPLPISGWTGANIVVSPTLDAQDGKTYIVSWQAVAGTVYGGTLNVSTGLLTVDWVSVDLGSLEWTKAIDSTPNYFRTVISDSRITSGSTNFVCSEYPRVGFNDFYNNHVDKCCSGYTGNLFLLRDSDYSSGTAEAFKEAMSGVQLVYRLKSTAETTYQLTPTEVSTLRGENNLWADCGSIDSLTYRADPTLYVDGIITPLKASIAPTEDGDTASRAYTDGQYFFRGSSFCKALTSIASGAAFTLDTNYTTTTVAAELFAANNT